MTFKEYTKKVKNITKTHTAPDNMSYEQRLRYYSKIIFGWINELTNESDAKTAIDKQRAYISSKLTF